jgi:hypothetical protein
VPARRIDVDVALHASASYYYCGFLQEKLQQEHVDDAGCERILDKMMN